MNPNPAFDSSIPVLTEVVLEQAPAEPAPADSITAEPAHEIPTLTEALPAAAEPVAAAPDWDAIELRIVERILAQLQPQLDAVVHNALASAADQIHVGMRQAVEQMVAQQIAAAHSQALPPRAL
jgi:hypothetical protein